MERFLDYALLRKTAREPYMLLETRRFDSVNFASFLFDRPVRSLEIHAGEDPERFFEVIDDALAKGLWAAGYFSYELGYLLEPKLNSLLESKRPRGPLAWIGFFEEPVITDHQEFGKDLFSKTAHVLPDAQTNYKIQNLELNTTREEYLQAISQIKSHLADGNTYQVNYTLKYRFSFEGSPESLYLALRDQQSVSYSACLFDGKRTVVSLSPELFFRKDGPDIHSKPMKGTAARGRTPEEDDKIAKWLADDPKNQAENVMIVDMIRNDLGRIAPPGGVHAPKLFDVERYESLFQMTSTVSARLEPGTSWYSILKALFPCASVTGAPKIRTMQIINELEKEPRGIYTGAIGYISPGGTACFNVAIRTAVIGPGNRGELGIGSGIVYDSDESNEYDECLLKAKFLTQKRPTFSLFETMRLEDGTIDLLDLHLLRLERSAVFFDFTCPLDNIRNILIDIAKQKSKGRFKLRLLLHRDGGFEINEETISGKPSAPLRFKISEKRTDTTDLFFYHKTTHRPLYEEERRRALEEGFDEVIFLNERNEITEGSYSNIFIEMSGRLYTPPVSSGLLPGTLRQKLLEEGRCSERILHPDDFGKAAKIYLGNSVQGLVEAILYTDRL